MYIPVVKKKKKERKRKVYVFLVNMLQHLLVGYELKE